MSKIITIVITTLNLTNVTVQVSNDMTCFQLKTYIYEKKICESLTQHEMEIQYEGVVIQNKTKLSDIQIVSGFNLTFRQQKISLDKVSNIIAQNQQDPISLEDITAKMPCGHSIGRDTMTALIRSLISQKKYEIRCPNINQETSAKCLLEWDFLLCKKVGVFSKQETEAFEQGLSLNWLKNFTKECPNCKYTIFKGDLKSNRVVCPKCKYGDFCYSCLGKWKGSKFCGNPDCEFINQFLKNAPWDCQFNLYDKANGNAIKNIKTPKYRACPNPNCMTIIEHEKACKHMECKQCKKSFCWVCLSTKDIKEKEWKCGKYNEYCGKVEQTQNFELGN